MLQLVKSDPGGRNKLQNQQMADIMETFEFFRRIKVSNKRDFLELASSHLRYRRLDKDTIVYHKSSSLQDIEIVLSGSVEEFVPKTPIDLDRERQQKKPLFKISTKNLQTLKAAPEVAALCFDASG